MDGDEIWETIVAIGFIVLVIWGGGKAWNWMFGSDDSYTSSSYSSNYSYSNNSNNCNEPENPYDYGSGHYAGYEWGENGNYCSGNSNSFIEGCEEYEAQEEAYDECISN
jgi:hypothetical protein